METIASSIRRARWPWHVLDPEIGLVVDRYEQARRAQMAGRSGSMLRSGGSRRGDSRRDDQSPRLFPVPRRWQRRDGSAPVEPHGRGRSGIRRGRRQRRDDDHRRPPNSTRLLAPPVSRVGPATALLLLASVVARESGSVSASVGAIAALVNVATAAAFTLRQPNVLWRLSELYLWLAFIGRFTTYTSSPRRSPDGSG